MDFSKAKSIESYVDGFIEGEAKGKLAQIEVSQRVARKTKISAVVMISIAVLFMAVQEKEKQQLAQEAKDLKIINTELDSYSNEVTRQILRVLYPQNGEAPIQQEIKMPGSNVSFTDGGGICITPDAAKNEIERKLQEYELFTLYGQPDSTRRNLVKIKSAVYQL